MRIHQIKYQVSGAIEAQSMIATNDHLFHTTRTAMRLTNQQPIADLL